MENKMHRPEGEIVVYQPDERFSDIIHVESLILNIRDRHVILDKDLALLYGVTTKRLNEQVKRNIERFPESFRFQLKKIEMEQLVANCDRFAPLKHSTSPSFAFTEQGVAMLSAVLHSQTAVNVSINIMNAFVIMRRSILHNNIINSRLDSVEKKQIKMESEIEDLFQHFEKQYKPPVEGIFYDGQIFDAYVFATELIRSARTRIVLIDNYIDESVLLMLSKREPGVTAEIRTGKIPQPLLLDLQKHNSQYEPVTLSQTHNIHDRFLIIDDTVYHIGASLKDLGKKLFAFSKMGMGADRLI